MPKQAGRDVDPRLGTSLIDVPDDKFITSFRAERERIQKAKEAPSKKAAETIWPDPDLSKNIWPAKK